jgi:hypothetical protein
VRAAPNSTELNAGIPTWEPSAPLLPWGPTGTWTRSRAMTRLRYPFAEIGLRCRLCNLTEYMETSGGRVGARMIDWRRRHAKTAPAGPAGRPARTSLWTSTARCSSQGKWARSFHGRPERMARGRSPTCSSFRTRPSTRRLCCSARRGAPRGRPFAGAATIHPATFCHTGRPGSLTSVMWRLPCSCDARNASIARSGTASLRDHAALTGTCLPPPEEAPSRLGGSRGVDLAGTG